MLYTIEKMLKAFEKNNIKYCHWKSNEHLEDALNGDTDLDILFEPGQRTELERVLDECGLKRFRATPLMQYNAIEDFLGFDQKTGKIWHLHTHYRMTIGEKHLKGYTVTPWTKHVLDNCIKTEEGIYTSTPEDELVLLLCRIALKLRARDFRRRLGTDDMKEISWLLKRIDKRKVSLSAEQMTSKRTTDIIMHMIEENLNNKNQFLKLQKTLRSELIFFTGYSKITSFMTRILREMFWLYGGIKRRAGLSSYIANRRVSPAGGCVVAILGCDGAGKSTTLEYLKKEFSKKIDVVTIYFGSGDGSCSILRKPMKFVAQRVGGKGLGHSVENEYKQTKKVSLKSRLYSFSKIIWAITLASEKKKKYRQMVKARNNGLLVLTDRYPQSIMPGCSDGPLLKRYQNAGGFMQKISEWENAIYESTILNPPDLSIKLVVPTEIAVDRKPEMTIEEIEIKKNIVMEMNVSEHNVVIDTSRNFKITIGEVMKEIWNLI